MAQQQKIGEDVLGVAMGAALIGGVVYYVDQIMDGLGRVMDVVAGGRDQTVPPAAEPIRPAAANPAPPTTPTANIPYNFGGIIPLEIRS